MHQIKRCQPLLGTFIEISLQAKLPEKALIASANIAFKEIERVQQALNFHRKDSELSQLNMALISAPNTTKVLSDDLATVLAFAHEIHLVSAGVYDISIASKLMIDKHLPNHLDIPHSSSAAFGSFSDISLQGNSICSTKPVVFDLGGIAKGYAVDQAIAKLPENISGYVNAGGDMRVIDWKNQQVSIKYARRPSALKALTLRNTALASSGSYYQAQGSQYFHPKTQRYNTIKGCISVFANNAMQADALTKVIALMKRKDAKPILKRYGASAIITNRFGFSRQVN